MGNVGTCCTLAPTPPVTKRLDSAGGSSSGGGGIEDDFDSLDSWDFNALALASDPQKLALASLSLMQASAWSCGASDHDALGQLVIGIRAGYLQNPFHNFAHAVDTLQMVALTGSKLPWDALLSANARLGLLVAALAHDIGHPGYSNVFLIDMQDDVAVRYNDLSPLENMHCSRLFELLSKDRYNVFQHIPRSQFSNVRKMMIDAIIHTDVANHNTVLHDMEALYLQHSDVFGMPKEGQPLGQPQIDILRAPSHECLVPRVLLLNADFASHMRCWEVAYPWASLMREELTAQGDKERAMGLSVPPMNDRTAMGLAEVQLGLFHSWLVPFVCAEARLFRVLLELCRKLSWNVRYWSSRLDSDKTDGIDGSPPSIVTDPRSALMLSMLLDPRLSGGSAASRSTQDTEGHADYKHELEAAHIPDHTSDVCIEGQQRPIVREIRRWQEAAVGSPCHRELVLLYVVSDDVPGQPAPTGQPVLFRYTIAPEQGMPGSSTPIGSMSRSIRGLNSSEEMDFSGDRMRSPASSQRPSLTSGVTNNVARSTLGSSVYESDAIPQVAASPPMAAQATMDSMCVQLNPDRFDFFLEAVLEDIPGLLQNAREHADAKAELEDLKSQTRSRGSLRRSIVNVVPNGVHSLVGALKAVDGSTRTVGFR